ncbi:hypothetical protein HHI36_011255 [Cryptolaemus montrouzieri]|uniref:Cyclin-dependent kinase inhibitor domain-containing protein n=1 Tax=Cryptolaemus montrouzieri TaxID=559131 RepID=A0ABD2MLA1_9CUCU
MSVEIYYNKPHNDLFQTSHFKKDIQKVKRILFGPVDHEETQRFVTQELERELTHHSERWNFDFKHERPLSPNGAYEWKPATPVKLAKPLKRRPSSEMEFDNHDLYCLPDQICKPKPRKAVEDDEQTPPKINHKMQSLITDFMQMKKNATPSKKSLNPRPSKIPRLSNQGKS